MHAKTAVHTLVRHAVCIVCMISLLASRQVPTHVLRRVLGNDNRKRRMGAREREVAKDGRKDLGHCYIVTLRSAFDTSGVGPRYDSLGVVHYLKIEHQKNLTDITQI